VDNSIINLIFLFIYIKNVNCRPISMNLDFLNDFN
jgi:hypothetical protein